MYLNQRERPLHFSKKIDLSKCCYICYERRGIVKNKNVCRKCLNEGIPFTSYTA